MEDDEKVRYTFMLAIVFFIFQYSMPVNYPDLFKWAYLLAGLVVLFAIMLFAIDGMVLNIVPDKIAKFIAWLGIFLVVLVMIIAFTSGEPFFNIDLP